MEGIDLYKELVIIRTMFDEDVTKGKQALTLFIKSIEDDLRKMMKEE